MAGQVETNKGFRIAGNDPIDDRYVYPGVPEVDIDIANGRLYEGILVYIIDPAGDSSLLPATYLITVLGIDFVNSTVVNLTLGRWASVGSAGDVQFSNGLEGFDSAGASFFWDDGASQLNITGLQIGAGSIVNTIDSVVNASNAQLSTSQAILDLVNAIPAPGNAVTTITAGVGLILTGTPTWSANQGSDSTFDLIPVVGDVFGGTTLDRSITGNVYTINHNLDPGNKHVPAGGATGNILVWSADGVAVWGSETVYTGTSPIIVTGSVISHSGGAGSVHVPAGGVAGQLLDWASDGVAQWSNKPTVIVPGGSEGQIQFNSSGAFLGVPELLWDDIANNLFIGGATDVARLSVSGEVVFNDGAVIMSKGTSASGTRLELVETVGSTPDFQMGTVAFGDVFLSCNIKMTLKSANATIDNIILIATSTTLRQSIFMKDLSVGSGVDLFIDAASAEILQLTSDIRLKNVKKNLKFKYDLSFVNNVAQNMISYEWKNKKGISHEGVSAQWVNKEYPKFRGIQYNKEKDSYGMSSLEFIFPLYKAIAELSARVQELESKIK